MSLKVSHNLGREATEMQNKGRLLRTELWRVVRIVSFNLERRVKFAMPVRFGRARASWGHWTIADVVRQVKGNISRAWDALWRENQADLSIEQGSNVEYVPKLNEGYSKQAPRGFIDDLGDEHQEQLDRLVDDLIDGIL